MTPIRLSQRLHPLESPVSSSSRPGGRLSSIRRSNILVFRARAANQETHGSRHAVDHIVGVQSIDHCSPDWYATHAGLVRIFGGRESIPERCGEEYCFDAHESVWHAVEQVAVGEAIGGFEDVFVDEDVEEPLLGRGKVSL